MKVLDRPSCLAVEQPIGSSIDSAIFLYGFGVLGSSSVGSISRKNVTGAEDSCWGVL